MMTLTDHIIAVAEFVKVNNTYFDGYYPLAELDDELGVVNDGNQPIFPSDEFGNYFYFRLPHNLQFDYSNSNMIADAGGGIGVKYDIVLVACVRDADEGALLGNLLITLGNYCKNNFRLTKANWGITVILQELAKIKKENQTSAVQKVPDNMSLVSISFTFTVPFIYQSLRCIETPCKNC